MTAPDFKRPRSLQYAGLSLAQLKALLKVTPQLLGAGWRVEPWIGRANAEVVVLGDGRLAEHARSFSTAVLLRTLTLPSEVMHAQLEDYLADRLPELAGEARHSHSNPVQAALRLGDFASALFCSRLDANAKYSTQAWHHPRIGSLVFHFGRGWVDSDASLASIASELLSPDWRRSHLQITDNTKYVASIESLVWISVLRWRDRFPKYPDLLRIRLTAFPDVALVTGQAALHEALWEWRNPMAISDLCLRTRISSDIASAIATAAALSGLVEVVGAVGTAARESSNLEHESDPRAKRSGALSRLAHFLGLRSARFR
jgi:hypothetical protein